MRFESGLEDSDVPGGFKVLGSLCFEQKLKFWTNLVTSPENIFRKSFYHCNHCELDVPIISADTCVCVCVCAHIRAKTRQIHGNESTAFNHSKNILNFNLVRTEIKDRKINIEHKYAYALSNILIF